MEGDRYGDRNEEGEMRDRWRARGGRRDMENEGWRARSGE